MKVLPAINCAVGDTLCVTKKIHAVSSIADWIHLDIADGVFSLGKSWGDPESFANLSLSLPVEVHLMVEHPERVVASWFKAGAKRVIVHAEAFPHAHTHAAHGHLRDTGLREALRIAEDHRGSVMLGILPETALASLREWLPHFSSFQVFSQATPGPSGQPFLKTVLPKIRALRESYPDRIIEVDGGVTLETARAARMAGADQCVAGTALFSAPDISEAYRALTAL